MMFSNEADLAYCIEVAEHMPPEMGIRLVGFLTEVAPIVVFSAAQPGQGGQGHINEQPPAYWISRFEAEGSRYLAEETGALRDRLAAQLQSGRWIANNVMVFGREPGRR